ncbi:hypothetical protein I4U23_024942 [Adineta vaga]|nr:hypothetical protein I4U23_024942 [Adineta vaga]
MEKKFMFELDEQLKKFDIDSQKLDAILQLKVWQKKMLILIEKIYLNRLIDIDTVALDINAAIKEKQIELKHIHENDTHHLLKLQHQIDEIKANIIIEHSSTTEDIAEDDDDDDFVIIDTHKRDDKTGEQVYVILPSSKNNSENRVSKLLTSEPVQQALAVGIAKTLTHMGTIAATSTTTIAATTMAKAALLTTVYGIGTMAYGLGISHWVQRKKHGH